MSNKFYSSVKEAADSPKKSKRDVSMGADIEFLWFSERSGEIKFVPASNFFSKEGMYGTDGRDIIGEFRITPANDPRVLMELFGRAFALSKVYVNGLNTGSIFPVGMLCYEKLYGCIQTNESIGVHVHFGDQELRKRNYKVSGIPLIVAALDCLAFPVAKIFESNLGNYIRMGTGYYGDLSDFRLKPYGVEYRSFPAFFDSKEITAGMFCLCKVIAQECLGDGNLNEDILDGFKLDRTRLYDKNYLRSYLRKVIFVIKNCCSWYPEYKEEIDLLFKMALDPNFSYADCPLSIYDSWRINTDELTHLEKQIALKSKIRPSMSPFQEYKNKTATIDFTRMVSLF